MIKSRTVGALLALALIAGACGSRVDDAGVQQDGDVESTTTEAGSSTASGMFGTMESPCGPGDASGTTDIGVTDSKITVTGYSDSGSSAAPGLNKGIDEASKAFVKWCNDQGGINGREIELKFQNANLFDYGPVVTQACTDSFALVGGLAVFDDAGAQLQVDCGIVNVPGAGVSSKQTGADLTYTSNPSPPNELLVGASVWLKEEFPEASQAAAMVHTDIASVDYVSVRFKEALESIGYKFVYDSKVAIAETNWPTYAVGMKDAGVKYLTAMSTWEEIAGLQSALAQQDFTPVATEMETNFYLPAYPERTGGDAEGTYVRLSSWPTAEADENPAMQTYLEALEASSPGVEPDQTAVFSFASWLLWATATKSLGSDVTREGLDKALSEIHEWDAGGLQGVSDPGANHPAPCVIVMQVKGDGFVRAFPTKDGDAAIYEAGDGFACNPDYVVDLKTDYDNGARKGS